MTHGKRRRKKAEKLVELVGGGSVMKGLPCLFLVYYIFDRPGVAGADLQTPLLLID